MNLEFNPQNKIIMLCFKAIALEKSDYDQLTKLLAQAWEEAENEFEKFITSYYISKYSTTTEQKLKWLEQCAQFALFYDDITTNSSLPNLYLNIGKCYEELNDNVNAQKNYALSESWKNNISDDGPFYHGTRADLNVGDLLTPGYRSNYQNDIIMNHIYFSAQINGAGLAAALASMEGHQRVYIVSPTGEFENDPNVTDVRFPGNPTRSYRSTKPLKIIGEITKWNKLTDDEINEWKKKISNNKGAIIN